MNTFNFWEQLHNPGHNIAAKNFSSVSVYSYRREGSFALAEAVRVAGMGGAWCMLEEGDWCMKPVKFENTDYVCGKHHECCYVAGKKE